jgi:acetyltransferase-like isoleucine patch superfamily enzyme
LPSLRFQPWGADAIVGKIDDVATRNGNIAALFIATDNQNGHIVTVNYEIVYAMECKAAPGTKIEIGENVRITDENDLVVVTKITTDSLNLNRGGSSR